MRNPLRRWVESDALRRWFAANVEHATGDALHLEERFTGINQHCSVTDGSHTWLLRWRTKIPGFMGYNLALEDEYRVLDALDRSGIPVPPAVAYCADEKVTGVPFYVMEWLDGVTPASPSAIRGRSHEERRCRSEQLAEVLLAIRALDLGSLGLHDVLPETNDPGIGRLAEAREERKQRAFPELDEVLRRLGRVVPPGTAECGLLHGDLHPYNIMLDAPAPSGIVAVLDWENASLGEPMLDLARVLLLCDDAISEPFEYRASGSPPGGFFDRDAIVDRYLEGSGDDHARLRYFEAVDAAGWAVFVEYLRTGLEAGGRGGERLQRAEALVQALARHALSAVP